METEKVIYKNLQEKCETLSVMMALSGFPCDIETDDTHIILQKADVEHFEGTELHLPDEIDQIGLGAFRYANSLEFVEFPENFTEIGDAAFLSCKALTEVWFLAGNSLRIGEGCFDECRSLQCFVCKGKPETLKLGEGCFKYTGIKNVDLSWVSTLEVEPFVFGGCKYLQSIKLPEGMQKLPDKMCWACEKLTEVSIPSTVEQIGASSFYYTGLTSITIPATVERISAYAFADCKSLQSICFAGNSLKFIGDEAFAKSAIQAIHIPESVKEIEFGAFMECSALQAVSLPGGLTSISKSCFEDSAITEIMLPDSVEDIKAKAFKNCRRLRVVHFGKGFKQVEDSSVFDNCSAMEILCFAKVPRKEVLCQILDSLYGRLRELTVYMPPTVRYAKSIKTYDGVPIFDIAEYRKGV